MQGGVNEELTEIASRCRLNGGRLLVPRCRFDPDVTRRKNKTRFDAQMVRLGAYTFCMRARTKAQVSAAIYGDLADHGAIQRLVTGMMCPLRSCYRLSDGQSMHGRLSQKEAASSLLAPVCHFYLA